jgi:molybdenum cofactor guanylyltransferase
MPATPPRGWALPGPDPRQAPSGQAPSGRAVSGRAATLPAFDAVVLAGGRAERLGGVDKPGLVVGTATMAATVTRAAVAAGARRVVLVGPPRAELAGDLAGDGGELAVVREDPPGAGPVPALRAGLADSGLAEAGAPWVALLAADLPFLRAEHLRDLLASLETGADGSCAGAVLADDRGRPQWLTSCWPADRLRSALAGYPGRSLRGLLGPLRPRLVSLPVPPGEPPPWLDCDTPADLAAARAWSGRPSAELITRKAGS